MAEPVRLQLSRKKGFDLQAHSLATNGLPAVNIARPGRYGNRFTVEEHGSAEEARDQFDHDLRKCGCFHPEQYEAYLKPLIGHNVACWCALDKPCHGDPLLEHVWDFVAEGVAA